MVEFDVSQYFLFILIVLLMISVYFNIQQRSRAQQHEAQAASLIKRAYFDHITELPNRTNIDMIIGEQISRTQRHKKTFLLAVVKVMNYHEIELRSKERAQDLIVETGERLLESIRNEDMLSRITENGFVIVFNEYLEDENSDIIFQRINNAFQKKLQHEKGSTDIKIKIGKSRYPDDGVDAEGLINEAKRQALS